jgi:hypothetical protein
VASCAYCGQRATVAIPSNPDRVCSTHAQEFWTAVFAEVRNRSDLCEHHNRFSNCSVCQELAALKERKVAAIAAAGTWPTVAERVRIQRAS